MTLLLRLAGIGVLVGVFVIIALQFPVFPVQLYEALYTAFSYMFAFDDYIPVKLAVNLVVALWLIEGIMISYRAVIRLYEWALDVDT